jgi:hypothetical protein
VSYSSPHERTLPRPLATAIRVFASARRTREVLDRVENEQDRREADVRGDYAAIVNEETSLARVVAERFIESIDLIDVPPRLRELVVTELPAARDRLEREAWHTVIASRALATYRHRLGL